MSGDCLSRITAIEAQIIGLKDLMKAEFEGRDRAVKASFDSNQRELVKMNEVREQLGAQKAEFVTRREHDLLVNSMHDVQGKISNMQGRYAVMALVFSVGVVLINIMIDLWGHISGNFLSGK